MVATYGSILTFPEFGGRRLAEAMQRLSEVPGVRVPTVAALASTSNRAGEYFPEKAPTGPKAAQVYQHHVNRLMEAAGFTRDGNWTTRSFPGHGHSAEYWAQRLPGARVFWELHNES